MLTRTIGGEVTSVTRFWTRTYNAKGYDLTTTSYNGAACTLATRTDAERANWLGFGADRVGYKYLGRIRPGMDQDYIVAEATILLKQMGPYRLWNNNCYSFIDKIYAEEAL